MFPQPLGLDLPEEVSPSVADQGAPVMTCPRGKFLWRTEGSGEKKPYLHQVPTATTTKFDTLSGAAGSENNRTEFSDLLLI